MQFRAKQKSIGGNISPEKYRWQYFPSNGDVGNPMDRQLPRRDQYRGIYRGRASANWLYIPDKGTLYGVISGFWHDGAFGRCSVHQYFESAA